MLKTPEPVTGLAVAGGVLERLTRVGRADRRVERRVEPH
jgi:hypothetical protein